MDKPEEVNITLKPFGPSVNITIKVKGDHLYLSLELKVHEDNTRFLLVERLPSTLSHHIPRWKSTTLHESPIFTIGKSLAINLANALETITTARANKLKMILVEFITEVFVNLHVPYILFNQINIMAYEYQTAINNTKSWDEPYNTPPVAGGIIFAVMR